MVVKPFFVIASQCCDLLQDQRHSRIHDAGTFVNAPQRTNASNDRGRDQWRDKRIHSPVLLGSVYRRQTPRVLAALQYCHRAAVIVTICFACCF